MDVLCIGEALVDLVPTVTGHDLARAETFVKAAGGAPANVAAGLARLGTEAAFLGCVGDDGFGRFLAATLAAAGVDIGGLKTTTAAPTALAAVSLGADGDRDFLFYGNPAAHSLFASVDLDEAAIRAAKFLHFGALGLIHGPLREATLRAVGVARDAGVCVSYDPNLRLSLWPSAAAAREDLRLGLSMANVVKIGADEIDFLVGDCCDPVEGARALWHPDLRTMAVTRGRRGALWLDPTSHREHPGFAVDAIDTTGAGDAFTAALLSSLVRCPEPTPDQCDAALAFALAAGALATTKRGAVPALPDRDAVLRFLANKARGGLGDL